MFSRQAENALNIALIPLLRKGGGRDAVPLPGSRLPAPGSRLPAPGSRLPAKKDYPWDAATKDA